MNSTELLDASIAAALQKMGAEVAKGVTLARRSCLTCVHFVEASETCALYNGRPPARVIVLGCDSHASVAPF